MAVVAPIVGWLIPGGGHILLKRYGRGILLLVSVVAMFLIGLACRGGFTSRMAETFLTYWASWATWARERFIFWRASWTGAT